MKRTSNRNKTEIYIYMDCGKIIIKDKAKNLDNSKYLIFST